MLFILVFSASVRDDEKPGVNQKEAEDLGLAPNLWETLQVDNIPG